MSMVLRYWARGWVLLSLSWILRLPLEHFELHVGDDLATELVLCPHEGYLEEVVVVGEELIEELKEDSIAVTLTILWSRGLSCQKISLSLII